MSDNTKAYPLAWPSAIPRTKTRQKARFKAVTMAAAFRNLKDELGRMQGTSYVVVSTNVPLKMNGEPYSDPGRLPDPGAAVYFRLNGKPYCLPCDRWDSVEHNLWAIAKHIEALRGQDRWGVGSIEQQFAGFKELEAGKSWREILGIKIPTPTEAHIRAQFTLLAKKRHPDVGGSHEAFTELVTARDAALLEVGR